MRAESTRRVALGSVAVGLIAVVVASASVGAVVVVAGPAAPQSSSAVRQATETAQAAEIDACTTITEPGRYVVTADVENATETCIEIKADDVVLDGAGHVVDAASSRFARHTGVRVTGAEDVVVTNLTLTDWGFAGVYFRGVSGSAVRNVTASDSRFGVTVRSSSEVRVVGVNATNNTAAGIDVSTTRDSVVADSRLADNRVGVSITTTSSRNRVVRNVVRNNRLGVVVSNSDDNVITENAFCGNRRAFVTLEQSRGIVFEDNRAC